MTRYLLAGGGTAGHVNPLLAVADRLREREPDAEIVVLGTAEGLEARLVPARGYELAVVERLPFPRRADAAALRFPRRLAKSVRGVRRLLRERRIDVVVGFGGYAAAPAYLAARRERVPIVVHEANALPGIANKLGSRLTSFVGVTFPATPLPHARVVGLPLRREIETLDRNAARPGAREHFGLEPDRPTLLVTGGSLGARRINDTVHAGATTIVATGYQVLHVQGRMTAHPDPGVPGYVLLEYCDRMDLAFAAADVVLSRSGAGAVAEISALGIPAVYVPYPVGNGEQALNAKDAVASGAALLVDDADVTEKWLTGDFLPLINDPDRLGAMAAAAQGTGLRDGADRMVDLVREAVERGGASRGGRA